MKHPSLFKDFVGMCVGSWVFGLVIEFYGASIDVFVQSKMVAFDVGQHSEIFIKRTDSGTLWVNPTGVQASSIFQI